MGFTDLVAAADRAVLNHLGGEDVTYQPSVGDPVVVKGLYDEQFIHFTSEGEIRGPAVFLMLADLPTHPDDEDDENENLSIAGLRLTVRGQEYQVRARQLDGLGGVHLVLSW